MSDEQAPPRIGGRYLYGGAARAQSDQQQPPMKPQPPTMPPQKVKRVLVSKPDYTVADGYRLGCGLIMAGLTGCLFAMLFGLFTLYVSGPLVFQMLELISQMLNDIARMPLQP